jgi:hypothetical protein
VADSYFKRLFSRAWRETKEFWSLYRWWVTISPPVVGVLFLLARSGWAAIMNAGDVLINASGGAAVAFIGTWIISLVRSAKLLDTDTQIEINARGEKITALEGRIVILQAPPTRTVAEQARYALVEVAINQYGEPARNVLRHLRLHGQLVFAGIYGPQLPAGMTGAQLRTVLSQLEISNVVTREQRLDGADYTYTYRIATGAGFAVDELLC